jgi:hypothetical protein
MKIGMRLISKIQAPFIRDNEISSILQIRGGGSLGSMRALAAAPSATSTPASALLPSLPAVAILTIAAFALAELLSFCGIFLDEEGVEAKRKARGFWDKHANTSGDAFDSIDNIIIDLESWWHRHRTKRVGIFRLDTWKRRVNLILDTVGTFGYLRSIQLLSSKHQFAIGCAIGMSFQKISLIAIKTAFVAYVSSEMAYNFRTAKSDSHDEDSDSESESERYKKKDQFYKRRNNFFPDDAHSEFDDITTSLKKGLDEKSADICTNLERFRHFTRRKVDEFKTLMSEPHKTTWEDNVIVGVAFGIFVKWLLNNEQ